MTSENIAPLYSIAKGIAKFGYFPGRNTALERVSTLAEVEFPNSEPLF